MIDGHLDGELAVSQAPPRDGDGPSLQDHPEEERSREIHDLKIALDMAEKRAASCDTLVTSLLDGFKCPCCGAERISHDPMTQYDMKAPFNHENNCLLKPFDPQVADEPVSVDLDAMSNVPSLNMKVGGQNLPEEDRARELQELGSALIQCQIRLGLLLEPIDADHVGSELEWLVKQEGNVGAAAFYVMKAFAQKNTELASARQILPDALEMLKAEPCGLCGHPLGEKKPLEAAGCLHRHQRRRSTIAELEKLLK